MKSKLKMRERAVAIGFVAPLFIGFAIFTAIPFIVAVIYSLVDYMPLQGKISPISFDVYISLFRGDLVAVGFGQAIINTLIIMLSIPINLLLGLLFSALITQKNFRGGTFFRVVLYLPAVTGAVAITLVWKLMFNETQGIVNIVLKNLGIIEENINWLGISSGSTYPRAVLILKNVWGGNRRSYYFVCGGNIQYSRNILRSCGHRWSKQGASVYFYYGSHVDSNNVLSPYCFYYRRIASLYGYTAVG